MKRSQKPKKPRAQKRATPPRYVIVPIGQPPVSNLTTPRLFLTFYSDTAEPKDDLQSQLVITRQKSPASLPISQDLLVRLNQLRTHTLNISIQPPPWLSIQEQAVHVCFKNFDLLYGSYDAHNLLLALAPMYGASSERSPLRFATHAAALSVIAQLPSKRNLQHEAARTYGKAIKTMAVALQDPEQSQSNETVLATLLLSWYEVCLSHPNHFQTRHGNIAVLISIILLKSPLIGLSVHQRFQRIYACMVQPYRRGNRDCEVARFWAVPRSSRTVFVSCN